METPEENKENQKDSQSGKTLLEVPKYIKEIQNPHLKQNFKI